MTKNATELLFIVYINSFLGVAILGNISEK